MITTARALTAPTKPSRAMLTATEGIRRRGRYPIRKKTAIKQKTVENENIHATQPRL